VCGKLTKVQHFLHDFTPFWSNANSLFGSKASLAVFLRCGSVIPFLLHSFSLLCSPTSLLNYWKSTLNIVYIFFSLPTSTPVAMSYLSFIAKCKGHVQDTFIASMLAPPCTRCMDLFLCNYMLSYLCTSHVINLYLICCVPERPRSVVSFVVGIFCLLYCLELKRASIKTEWVNERMGLLWAFSLSIRALENPKSLYLSSVLHYAFWTVAFIIMLREIYWTFAWKAGAAVKLTSGQ
jgi:hypothetical protein